MNRPTAIVSGSIPSRSFRARFVSALAAMAVVAGGASLSIDSAFAADKDKDKKGAPAGPQISKKVLPPLKAAGDAFNAKNFDVALAKAQEAMAVEGKTEYDEFRINEILALIYVNNGQKWADALAIYEKNQAHPEYLDAQAKESRLKAMTQLAFRAQAHDKTVQYGKEWIATHPDDTAVIDLMSRSAYIAKDFKTARDLATSAIAVNEKAGKTPDEIWLQLISSTSINLEDHPAALVGYEKLVRYYPKPEHWSKALDSALALEKNDAAIIHLLRLMADLDVMKRPELYVEYAQRAQDEALPGEAAKVLETGFEKKLLSTAEQQRMLTTTKEKARIDKAQLPEIEKETKASKIQTGQPQAGLGLAYFSNQMYEQAVPPLEAALAKSGLKTPERYRMILAISYYRLGQKEKAREEFQKLASNPALARVAGLWTAHTYN